MNDVARAALAPVESATGSFPAKERNTARPDQSLVAAGTVVCRPDRRRHESAASGRPPRILILVTEDWYFWSHRRSLARAAAARGYDVTVATRVNRHAVAIRELGLRLIPLPWTRGRGNLSGDVRALLQLGRLLAGDRVDLLHCAGFKAVLFGNAAAFLVRSRARVLSLVAGYPLRLKQPRGRHRLLGWTIRFLLRAFARRRRARFVFQTDQDRHRALGDLACSAAIIPGSGVDLKEFFCSEEPAGVPIVLLAARLLWSKGLADFTAAAELVRCRGLAARFVLVGHPDPGSPDAVPEARLRSWQNRGLVEWWGGRDDMPSTLRQASVVVLPSHSEGVPKILLEAGAVGRAVVASDLPGNRLAVREGETGLLVPVRNARRLAVAIATLLQAPDRRREMGRAARQHVAERFSQEATDRLTLREYGKLLGSADSLQGVSS